MQCVSKVAVGDRLRCKEAALVRFRLCCLCLWIAGTKFFGHFISDHWAAISVQQRTSCYHQRSVFAERSPVWRRLLLRLLLLLLRHQRLRGHVLWLAMKKWPSLSSWPVVGTCLKYGLWVWLSFSWSLLTVAWPTARDSLVSVLISKYPSESCRPSVR